MGSVVAGKVQCSSLTVAAEVGVALESEAVASAVHEAEYEQENLLRRSLQRPFLAQRQPPMLQARCSALA